jgi:hypothetical protein
MGCGQRCEEVRVRGVDVDGTGGFQGRCEVRGGELGSGWRDVVWRDVA